MHVYEVRPRKEDKRGFDLISDALPFPAGCGALSELRHSIRSSIRSRSTAQYWSDDRRSLSGFSAS